ncbi:AAA family ATPase [Massilia sp. UMI-21]|nr:AAA family ATPase [Massilia sp. UMI-21]
MDALARQRRLIDRVARTLQLAAGRVARFETHISWVLVAGGDAYKFKKALTLPFVDCSTLAARRFYCREECRLNSRLAPDLYRGVVAVGGDPASPTIGAAGTPREYAVWMRAFEQDALWSVRLADGLLGGDEVDRLAALLAAFHRRAPRAPPGASWGTAAMVAATFAATMAGLESALADDGAQGAERVQAASTVLRECAAQLFSGLPALASARRTQGMVRECHGDLHCGNILTRDGEVQAFDCIEFDPALRWIDTIDDLAFACMDLACRGSPGLAARLLSGYLECSGDHAGLAMLRLYRMHRALVRARVMLLRARQPRLSDAARAGCLAQGRSYLDFARRCAHAGPVALVAMHGFSGSGKTTVARLLVELLGAVQLRSDVERKRLPAAAPGLGRQYGAAATRRTYARLGTLARTVLGAGWPAVVDAACLRADQRTRLRRLAAALGVPFFIVDVRAGCAAMLARIAARGRQGDDASDADAAVLDMQLRSAEPLASSELAHTIVVDANTGIDREQLRQACAPLLAALARQNASGQPVADGFQAAHIDPAHTTTHAGP